MTLVSRKAWFTAASAVIVIFSGSCATSPKKPQTQIRGAARPRTMTPALPPVTPGISAQENSDYRDIQTLYAKGAFEAAMHRLKAFQSRYPQSRLIPQAENLRGLVYLGMKIPTQAIVHFRKAIELQTGNTNFNQYVLFNLATAQYEADQVAESFQTLTEIQPEGFDQENKIKYHHLKALVQSRRGLSIDAAREGLTASRSFSELQVLKARETNAPIVVLVEQSLQEVNNTLALEQLYQEFESAPLADMILFRLVSKESTEKNMDKAEAHLQVLLSRFSQSPLYPKAAELVRAAQSESVIDNSTVGILLPMKGKYAKFGARSLQGIELAFRVFNQNDPESKITLVVEDSGEEPEQAIRALNRLVLKHHVIAVIGPLLSKGVDQITQRAQELGVPMISLSKHVADPDLSAMPENVFQGGLTLKLQAQEVARYAVQRLGLKKFAILAPHDKTGEESAKHFWDTVESMGGEVVGYETYTPGETDFRQPVDKLSGLYYTEARQRELDALAKEREVNKIKRRTRKTEQYFSLKPIVEYEAVFIPDEPKVAGQILPTFAYRDVDNVKFLGISAWNSQEFITRAQSYGESSVFVDAYLPDSPTPAVRRFIDKYKNTFGMDPTSLEAISFDAAKVLENALTRGGPTATVATRSDLLDRLKGTKSFPGITGRISYQDGQLMRDLRVLSVRTGRITEIVAD